jgi:hypothetical protein
LRRSDSIPLMLASSPPRKGRRHCVAASLAPMVVSWKRPVAPAGETALALKPDSAAITAVANLKKSKDWSTEWRERAARAPFTWLGSAFGRSLLPQSCHANNSGDQIPVVLLAGWAARVEEIIIASNILVILFAFPFGFIFLSPIFTFHFLSTG